MKKFEGKVVLATGAGHGIGEQVTVQFAEQGANTVIAGYNVEFGTETAEEIACDYVKSLFVQADVLKPEDMDHVREKVFEEFGRTDILVLNVGVALKKKVNEFTFEEWNRIISINLNGLFNAVKAFCNDSLANHGSIAYISFGSALDGTGGAAAYPASKAGGKGLIRGLARELGPEGVDVSTITPCLIDTGDIMCVNYPTQAELNAVLEKTPACRYGTVRDVANLAAFLADKDNSYIRGQTILLDSGRTIA